MSNINLLGPELLGPVPADLMGVGEENHFWSHPIFHIIQAASIGICAYHGYKRNESVGWAIGWALLGGLFPIITPAIALAQGFGKPTEEVQARQGRLRTY